MINKNVPVPREKTTTSKKPRRKPTKPLTPLQQAELADPLPFGKLYKRMQRQSDRRNAQFGIKSRAGKFFDK